jgi:hypothetical protein
VTTRKEEKMTNKEIEMLKRCILANLKVLKILLENEKLNNQAIIALINSMIKELELSSL